MSSSRVVAVLGMHRSGTSAITRGLRCLGLDLGADLKAPADDNPKGFWEDRAVCDLDDRLLHALGLAWDSPVVVGPPASPEAIGAVDLLREDARALVRERVAALGRWAVKDPRMCRLLFFWEEVFAGLELAPDYVVAVRDPRSVAASLHRRDGLPEQDSHLLWLAHVVPSLAAIVGRRGVVVDFDLLLLDPAAQLGRVGRALDLTLDLAEGPAGFESFRRDFLDAGSRHFRDADLSPDLGPGVPALVRRAWALVRGAARDEIDARGEDFARRTAGLVQSLDDLAPLCRRLWETQRTLEQAGREHRQAAEVMFRQVGRRTVEITRLEQRERELGARVEELSDARAKLAGAVAAAEAALQESHRRNAALAVDLQTALQRAAAGEELRAHLNLVTGSRSWRLTAPLRSAWGVAGRVARSRLVRDLGTLPALLEARRRGLFDPARYRERNADLKYFRAFPFLHWFLFGAREGRSPGPSFDAAWYRQHYADVAGAGMHPVAHYLRHGVGEGRLARPPRADGPRPAGRSKAGPGGAERTARALRALIVDSRWPQPDRDAGSVETSNLVAALRDFGYRLTFAAGTEDPDDAPYRRELERQGVQCLPPRRGAPLSGFLEAEGADLDLCVLYRVSCGGAHFEAVRRLAGRARVVFNTVDLHFVREEREARLQFDPRARTRAAATRERELYLVRNADATVVVSAHELERLERLVPGARVVHLPLARPVHVSAAGFAERRGVGFVGGFAHAPNVDAVRFFVAEVWPLVRRRLPECEFTIVGADLPDDVCRELPPGVRYLGHLPDLAPWFDGIRVSVAPLRFGAGAKGKVVSSLAHGVPCVTTSIGAEGLNLEAGSDLLVADGAEGLAARVIEAYADQATWERLARRGLEVARRAWSPEDWRRRLAALLESVGLPSVPAAAGTSGAPDAP